MDSIGGTSQWYEEYVAGKCGNLSNKMWRHLIDIKDELTNNQIEEYKAKIDSVKLCSDELGYKEAKEYIYDVLLKDAKKYKPKSKIKNNSCCSNCLLHHYPYFLTVLAVCR